jgi:hypothetical protein
VTVHEPQAHAPHGVADARHRPEEQGAVPAEHERALATSQRGGHRLAQDLRGHTQVGERDDPRLRVAHRVAQRRRHLAGVGSPEHGK